MLADQAGDHLVARLFEHEDATSIRFENGPTLVRKLEGGPLAYLHKLFPPLSGPIPTRYGADYSAFLRHTNGATLYANRLHLHGLVDAVSRSLDPKDMLPTSMTAYEKEFVFRNRPLAAVKTGVGVGSVSGYAELFDLVITPDERFHIIGPGCRMKRFDNFWAGLDVLLAVCDSALNTNMSVDSSRLECELMALLTPL